MHNIKRARKIVLILPLFYMVVCGATRNFLSGIEFISLNAPRSENIWSVSGVNVSTGIEIKLGASVPGGIYTDLEENGVLSSPIFHEYNDMENRWVGWLNWTYTRAFAVTQSLLDKEQVVLVCEGLDTVSQVLVNGERVGQSDNMFVRYIYDIKHALHLGENLLQIKFESPVKYAQSEYRKHEKENGYAVRPHNLVPEFRGENQVQFIRKTQSSFSWDWGPSYPSSGIWKDIYIEGYNGAIMRDVMIFSTPSKSPPDESAATQWNVTARIYYDCASHNKSAILKFHRSGSKTLLMRHIALHKGKGQSVDITLIESGDVLKLWWPNGYGEQHLYKYSLVLGMDDLIESSSRQLRIGFRTVQLVQDFVQPNNSTLKGREFYFRVNGVKMYSKGSNSIPLHALPERITGKHTEWLLRAAKISHQNMIRVWGGGMYESDSYYDWADEYGILIWEDFMFACALYPATRPFLESVGQEVETQVKRLQHRTSLALWAGNNENEGGLRGNWFGYNPHYMPDYIKLYIGTIKRLVEKLDPSRSYLPSSPTNGIQTEEEGWVSDKPADLKYGDIHAYNYYGDNWDWKIYTRGRYSSEYGYQSFPHYDTLAQVADNISEWTWRSARLEHRQRHPRGQHELYHIIARHFPFPADYDSPEALPHMLYMSQLSQCMAQKTQTEFYRRLQDKLYEDGTGHNMGALYWQLNDVWPGCSWSTVEVNGRWKIQMYYAQKFFSPVLASPYQHKNGDVIIELISDSQRTFEGTLSTQIFKLNRSNSPPFAPVYHQEIRVEAQFLTSKQVLRIQHSTLKSVGCEEKPRSNSTSPCLVYTTLAGTPDNFLFLQYPTNRLSMQDPKLQISSPTEMGDGKTIRFRLTSDAVALFVFMSLTDGDDQQGYFSDNGFVQVTPDKEMTYYSANGISANNFLSKVKVVSLYNVSGGQPNESQAIDRRILVRVKDSA